MKKIILWLETLPAYERQYLATTFPKLAKIYSWLHKLFFGKSSTT